MCNNSECEAVRQAKRIMRSWMMRGESNESREREARRQVMGARGRRAGGGRVKREAGEGEVE